MATIASGSNENAISWPFTNNSDPGFKRSSGLMRIEQMREIGGIDFVIEVISIY